MLRVVSASPIWNSGRAAADAGGTAMASEEGTGFRVMERMDEMYASVYIVP